MPYLFQAWSAQHGGLGHGWYRGRHLYPRSQIRRQVEGTNAARNPVLLPIRPSRPRGVGDHGPLRPYRGGPLLEIWNGHGDRLSRGEKLHPTHGSHRPRQGGNTFPNRETPRGFRVVFSRVVNYFLPNDKIQSQSEDYTWYFGIQWPLKVYSPVTKKTAIVS